MVQTRRLAYISPRGNGVFRGTVGREPWLYIESYASYMQDALDQERLLVLKRPLQAPPATV